MSPVVTAPALVLADAPTGNLDRQVVADVRRTPVHGQPGYHEREAALA
jgi:hypothetical protein